MAKNKKILYILVVILGISVAYRITHPFRQKTVDRLKFTAGTINKIPGNGLNKKLSPRGKISEDIRLNLFINPPVNSSRVLKNIFSLHQSKPGLVDKGIDAEEISLLGKTQGTMETDPLTIAKKDIQRFKVFGVYESGGEKVVFLEKGKDVYSIQRGDRIDGKYLVTNISEKKITIKADNLDTPLEISTDMMDAQGN